MAEIMNLSRLFRALIDNLVLRPGYWVYVNWVGNILPTNRSLPGLLLYQ